MLTLLEEDSQKYWRVGVATKVVAQFMTPGCPGVFEDLSGKLLVGFSGFPIREFYLCC